MRNLCQWNRGNLRVEPWNLFQEPLNLHGPVIWNLLSGTFKCETFMRGKTPSFSSCWEKEQNTVRYQGTAGAAAPGPVPAPGITDYSI